MSAREPLGYRYVALACGDLVLSHARNWYVPTRLEPAIVRELAVTDRPFGAAIAPLGLRRERLASTRGRARGCPHDTVLTVRAVIRIGDGPAVAYVTECYRAAVLGG